MAECQNIEQEDLIGAVERGDASRVLAALARGGDANAVVFCEDGVERTVLAVAAFLGHAHLVPVLVEKGAKVDQRAGRTMTAIHHAAREGKAEALKALLKVGADLNSPEIRYFNSPLHFATMTKQFSCVKVLVEAGADLNCKDIYHYRPLHIASRTNYLPIIKYLLESRCDRGARTVQGWTALHVAGMSGSEEAVKVLIESGLDLEALDNDGRTAAVLTDECGQGHMYWYFAKTFGASTSLSPAVKARQSMERYDIEQLVLTWASQDIEANKNLLRMNTPTPFDGHYQDHSGRTALHVAAENGHRNNVVVLLEDCKIYPAVRTHAGKTPAELARAAGHEDLAKMITEKLGRVENREEAEELYKDLLTVIADGDDVKKASSLLARGCPMKPCGLYSTHAIVLAVTSNRCRILTLLVAAGASLFVTVQGLTLLQVAWFTADVTMFVKMIITKSILHVLQEEHKRAENWPELQKGISSIIATLQGEKPWMACWPVQNPLGNQPILIRRLIEAIYAKCSLTVSFLLNAGAMPLLSEEYYGISPFEVSLKENRWGLATRLARNTGGLYVADSQGKLYRDYLPRCQRMELESDIFEQELRKIFHEEEKVKDEELRQEIKLVRHLQRKLYEAYQSGIQMDDSTQRLVHHIGCKALLGAARFNLVQLAFLLFTKGEMDVNSKLESMTDSTAVHQAAAFGNHNLVFMMHKIGANITLQDRYHHTALHLAPMFGHRITDEQLRALANREEPVCKSGTTPTQVRNNFEVYLRQYGVDNNNVEQFVNYEEFNSANKALEKHLGRLSLDELKKQSWLRCVNYNEGEAKEVCEAVMAEMKLLMDKVGQLNPALKGSLILLGSAADGTRLCAPDEFDFNLVIQPPVAIDLNIEHLGKNEAILKGHKSVLKVKPRHSKAKLLKESNLKKCFYDAVVKSLEGHTCKDRRLSLTPPGVTRTQVGITLSLAWQGEQFPLLLVGVDFVPVLAVPWPKTVSEPPLTPPGIDNVFISSLGNGKWRFSFAAVEVETLKGLDDMERLVYLTCKNLLANLKAEPWMPKVVKNLYTWWDSQLWKLSIPAGFALKNCFLRIVEKKRENSIMWVEENLHHYMTQIFLLMVGEYTDPETMRTLQVSRKIYPYYGGDFESPKLGEGVKEILSFIEEGQRAQNRPSPGSQVSGKIKSLKVKEIISFLEDMQKNKASFKRANECPI
ncbi:serine/threonine-protein phosphatase 6 regulatory ankyrin repeat subunit A-like [Penaeus indicus]|uniref:serine/threonine-protein phosphatase 6 regulatory ankyrin repeat subunit A-like n=1 Tax=Penaeus indicus TaxID=29960 RepID=UPI00300CDC36